MTRIVQQCLRKLILVNQLDHEPTVQMWVAYVFAVATLVHNKFSALHKGRNLYAGASNWEWKLEIFGFKVDHGMLCIHTAVTPTAT